MPKKIMVWKRKPKPVRTKIPKGPDGLPKQPYWVVPFLRALSIGENGYVPRPRVLELTPFLLGIDPNAKNVHNRVKRCFQEGHRKGSRPVKVHTTCKGEGNLWGITPAGLEIVRANPYPNWTSAWLRPHLKAPGGQKNSKLFKAMVTAVTTKCPVSASSLQIEDHVQECLTRLMHRDSLSASVLEGKKITYSHLCTYAVRSAWTDARNSATNPVCRHFFGARTETERKYGNLETSSAETFNLSFLKDEDGNVRSMDIVDESHHEIDNFAYFKGVWDQMILEMKKTHHRNWEKYETIVDMRSGGYTMAEIADHLNLSTTRISAMFSEAKKLLERMRDEGSFLGPLI